MSLIYRQSAKATIVTMVGAVVGFLTTFFVLTWYLTPEEVGLTRLLVEVAMLLGGFALFATQSSSVRYFPFFHTEDGKDRGFVWLVLLIPLIGFVVFSLLYYLLRTPLVSYFTSNKKAGAELFREYYLLVLPLMVFTMYMTVSEVYCTLKQRVVVPRMVRELILRILLCVAYMLYGIGLFPSFNFFLTAFVGCYGVCMLLDLGYMVFLSPRAFTSSISLPDHSVRRDFINYTGLTLLSALGSNIVTRLDLFMVSAQMGLDYAGIYSIAFFIVAVIEMPSRSLTAISSPMVSSALHNSDTERVRQLYQTVSQQQLLVGLIIFTLIWTNIDFIFGIMPNSDIYIQGKWVVFILGIGRLIDLSFSFGNAVLRYSRYYVWSLVYTLFVAFLTVGFNLVLIERIGMEGAAIATLLTFVISYTFQQVILWSKLRLSPITAEHGRLFLTLGVVVLICTLIGVADTPISIVLKNALVLASMYVLIRRTESFKLLLTETKSFIQKL